MLPKLLNILTTAGSVVLLFNLIIIVHEIGHFLAARWRGLHIEEFGVWFGKPLWKKQFNGVWYSLGSIPAGGFVKLPQLAPMDLIEGESESQPDGENAPPAEPLPPISALDKIIVAFAGPLFSFLFAIALAVVVWSVGKPVNDFENSTEIGFVDPKGPAAAAGLQPGDTIKAVDGHPVDRFMGPLRSVKWHIVRSEGETIRFDIERKGEPLAIHSGWSKAEGPGWKRKELRTVGIGPRQIPNIDGVLANSPAEQAGFQKGDFLLKVNDTPVFNVLDGYNELARHTGQPNHLVVRRNHTETTLTLIPTPHPSQPNWIAEPGLQWGHRSIMHPLPSDQIRDAVLSIVNMLDALFAKRSDVSAQHFSGPVGIMKVYYSIFENEGGWLLALAFSVFFNVNLALANLLPFPVLDGGHITLALIESIRRKPFNPKYLGWLQTSCAVAAMAFMAYLTFFDVTDFFNRRKDKSAAPAAAPSATQPAAAPTGNQTQPAPSK
jgi:regulator of sigma E protease